MILWNDIIKTNTNLEKNHCQVVLRKFGPIIAFSQSSSLSHYLANSSTHFHFHFSTCSALGLCQHSSSFTGVVSVPHKLTECISRVCIYFLGGGRGLADADCWLGSIAEVWNLAPNWRSVNLTWDRLQHLPFLNYSYICNVINIL